MKTAYNGLKSKEINEQKKVDYSLQLMKIGLPQTIKHEHEGFNPGTVIIAKTLVNNAIFGFNTADNLSDQKTIDVTNNQTGNDK